MDQLLYGAAYYDEYMPYERLDKDISMMKKAGINVIRIAESTWSTEEPEEGVFDFSYVTKVLDACEKEGIYVIVGTPTYAIPAWMAKAYPEVMVTDRSGRRPYGARQIMDITHPAYRFFAERIIRRLMEAVKGYRCVIGFQLDNETKHFGTSSENVQQMFVRYIRKKYDGDLERFNHDFGLAYWSNRINSWEEFPSVTGTINGSLGCEFEKFQRQLVTDFLKRQAEIVGEYKREDQFITHNFDFEWKGYSHGVQPDVDHFKAAEAVTIAGCDIYHPTQDLLTGKEIAFGGDLIRSLKKDNYLLIETEAQGFPEWTPYEGQLRLQAFSHLASGADSVMYWHWHSIHNACETYWKGILSHDFQENATYREACIIGNEFARLGKHLVNLKKKNEVAVLVSNEALTALNWFRIQEQAPGADAKSIYYNDVMRWMYDTLYHMNIECDFIWPESENLDQYKAIIVPALYAAPDELLIRLNQYVENGGTLIASFKTAFANENVKVSHEVQPHILSNCFGVHYDQFTFPKNVGLTGEVILKKTDQKGNAHPAANVFMELLVSEGAEVLASYEHYNWKDYAAITRNHYGKGQAVYIGCMTDEETLKSVYKAVLPEADVEIPEYHYPIIVRKGLNDLGKTVCYFLNYSGMELEMPYDYKNGIELLENTAVENGTALQMPAWGVKIVEEA